MTTGKGAPSTWRIAGAFTTTAFLVASSISGAVSHAPQNTAPAFTAALIALPEISGGHAIWGATGQDGRGRVWFGVTTGGIDPKSAHLVEYNAATGQAIDRGNVIDELRKAGLLRAGEQQAKIHSKIVQAADGALYFASMDEDGENENGSRLPTWGGHLWRLNLATNRWQHLLRVPEALIAVGASGRYIYALGYFGHVLYQYDTQTGRTGRVQVGSVDGHISRNLVVDDRGHVYVPRLTSEIGPDANRVVRISFVEIGPDLRDVRSTPVEVVDYLGRNRPTDAHGIVGVQPMADRSIAFTTHSGRLFRIVPPSDASGPAEITKVGMIHPRGDSYPASLFTEDGRTSLATVARTTDPQGAWEWVTCLWPALRCRATPLTVSGRTDAELNRSLLYGSATRDANGGHYVVGIGHDYHPIVIRIESR